MANRFDGSCGGMLRGISIPSGKLSRLGDMDFRLDVF
jgi:hypothetical protein